MKPIYIFRLPDDHPTDPGRYEVDFADGPTAEQGGELKAGPYPFTPKGWATANSDAIRLELEERGETS